MANRYLKRMWRLLCWERRTRHYRWTWTAYGDQVKISKRAYPCPPKRKSL